MHVNRIKKPQGVETLKFQSTLFIKVENLLCSRYVKTSCANFQRIGYYLFGTDV